MAVEGASLRAPGACRQNAVNSLPCYDLSSQQFKKIHRSAILQPSNVADSCQSGKERKSKKKRGNKKRQTASTAAEQGAGDHKTSCARRSLRQAVCGQSLVKSKTHSQSLGLSTSKAALVPLNISLSLSLHHSTSQSQRTLGHRSHISGSIQLHTATQHSNRMYGRLHPPLRLPLPASEVFPFPLM